MKLVILLRGINVGSTRSLPMKELVAILESLGFENVQTYIQSGNVVADVPTDGSPASGEDVADAIEKQKGFKPSVLILPFDALMKAVEANPFPEAESEPKTLHLFFLSAEPDSPDFETMDAVKRETERYVLGERVLYFHGPEGFGTSKLAASVEKHLGVAATARNWRTVGKIVEMAGLA